jgi:hypothetical protein
MNSHKKRSLTGLKPTGNLHLGNYLGALKPALSPSGSRFSSARLCRLFLQIRRWPGSLSSI